MPDLRMPEINHVTISGRIASDITDRDFSTGNTVSEFNFAHAHFVSGQGRDRKEETTWLRVKCWGELAKRVKQHMGKGDPIIVEGRLTTEEWQGKDGKKQSKDGKKQSKTVIVAQRVSPLSWKEKDGAQQPQQPPSQPQQPAQSKPAAAPAAGGDDDDLF